MFEVTSYEHPLIFVAGRQTRETYRSLVGEYGVLIKERVCLDQGDARRTATRYSTPDLAVAKALNLFRSADGARAGDGEEF
jgi:hypothetical protein